MSDAAGSSSAATTNGVTADTGPLKARPALAVATLCRRELVRFLRQRNRVFGALGQPIIFWLLFSEGFRGSDIDYLHFFPGTLVMILLFTAIFATISIIEDRREGFLQSVLVAPVPRWAMTFGMISGGATLAMIQALLFLVLGYVTLDGLTTDPLLVVQLLLMMAVIAIALTSLGFILAWQMESTHGFHAIMSLVLLPMWLLSGAFFPAGTEGTGWLSWIVRANPLTYGVSGLRQLLVHGGQTLTNGGQGADVGATAGSSLAVCWVVTILFAGVAFAVACYSSRRSTKGDLLS